MRNLRVALMGVIRNNGPFASECIVLSFYKSFMIVVKMFTSRDMSNAFTTVFY